jgi:HAD superfamily hydrolase (TIGR01509 family)
VAWLRLWGTSPNHAWSEPKKSDFSSPLSGRRRGDPARGDKVLCENGCAGVMWSGRTVKGIIFDVDGTLTDSIDAYHEIFRVTCARVGIAVRREDVLESMALGANIWERIFPPALPDRDEKLARCMQEIPKVFSDVISQAKPFPGLEKVLSDLRDMGIVLGIVTSSWRLALQPLVKHNLIRHFQAIITREDRYARKPSAEGMLECLHRMGISPDCALTVGDSPLDVQAGKRAEILTIGVLSGISSRELLEAEEPTLILDGVSQLPGVVTGKGA